MPADTPNELQAALHFGQFWNAALPYPDGDTDNLDLVMLLGGYWPLETVVVETVQEIVPYLIGDTEDAVRVRIEALYLVLQVTGTGGTVVSQFPPFLTLVDRGTTVQVTMGGPLNSARGSRRGGLQPYGVPDQI